MTGWRIEGETAIFDSGGVAVPPPGEKAASITNFQSISTTYTAFARTA